MVWERGRKSALLIEMLVCMSCYLILLCQTGGSGSDPLKAIISLLEASKCSGGLLQALTCYLFYLHPKISDPQLIQYDPFNCVLVSLLYIVYGSM